MQSVGYWEAWSLWWSGTKLEDFAMWGLPMLWWARIGKCLQFAGTAIVILDLVGPERLRALRNKGDKYAEKARRYVRNLDESSYGYPEGATPGERQLIAERRAKIDYYYNRYFIIFFCYVVPTVGVLYVGGKYFNELVSGYPDWLIHIAGWLFLLVVAILILWVIFGATLYLPVLILRVPSVVSEWLFGAGKKQGHPIRVAAFLAIVVGFHLDLLGS
ncbi:hypothetical protein [Saccharopolyspora phatthalungensis]|uniref:Uncharacterized protein n=1 Tax=Saccharopolyspora phatthalungensis TaxID=664693 RepID=A0A840Q4S5_9PSEU|nr:hypothetical protein [Saccharopolyspora phatthalungensis]MBB5155564.1 hypothetical protein [Saccharopolyspora phatthalungensis]